MTQKRIAHSLTFTKEQALELIETGATPGYVEADLIVQKQEGGYGEDGTPMVMIVRERETGHLYRMFYLIRFAGDEIELSGNEGDDMIILARVVLNEITVKRYISVTSKPKQSHSVFKP